MSLINVFLTPSKALIAVDTQASDPAAEGFISVDKMVHFPRLNVVMAGRGTQGFLLVLSIMVPQFRGSNFDSLAKAMPGIFDDAYNAMIASQPKGTDPSSFANQEIVLVGWSGMLNRMRALVYAKREPGADIGVTEIEDPGYMMPWEDRWGAPPEGSDRRAMIDLSLAQTRYVKQESPGTAMGGRLMLAELTRHEMSFNAAAELSPVQSMPIAQFMIRQTVFGAAG
jgi:hypothetical protein